MYGIRNGSNQHNVGSKTQKDFASELGMTDEQLRRFKKLNTLIPELQDMVEDGESNMNNSYSMSNNCTSNGFAEGIGEGNNSSHDKTQKDLATHLKI